MGPHVWQRTIADLEALGHQRVDTLEHAEAYINTESRPLRIPTIPDSVSFVQHCFTGVNQLIDAHVITDTGVRWANMAGGFAQPVAESALGLMLSQAHHHKAFALAGTWRVARDLDRSQQWLHSVGEPRCVVIFGAGGIAQELIRLLQPFGVHVIAVNRSGRGVAGADETFAMKDAHGLWSRGDFIVNILPLTQETKGLVDRDVFAQMKPSAIFINVGRGATVVTDDLVDALHHGCKWQYAV
ncbi:reductase [Corynebacterium diphtheriae]|nr:reductase [Corynebacterium diphtheriae]